MQVKNTTVFIPIRQKKNGERFLSLDEMGMTEPYARSEVTKMAVGNTNWHISNPVIDILKAEIHIDYSITVAQLGIKQSVCADLSEAYTVAERLAVEKPNREITLTNSAGRVLQRILFSSKEISFS